MANESWSVVSKMMADWERKYKLLLSGVIVNNVWVFGGFSAGIFIIILIEGNAAGSR